MNSQARIQDNHYIKPTVIIVQALIVLSMVCIAFFMG